MQTTAVSALRSLGISLLFTAMIGACGGDNGQTPSVTPGITTNASATAHLNGLPADRVTFYGADEGDQAASIVSGDFNGDGFSDVVLGAASADGPDNGRTDAGEAYVFLGPFAPGSSLDDGTADYDSIFYGANAGDGLSRTVAVGDFNGDGVDDLVMASPSAASQAGIVYVMYGGAWPAVTDFATADPDVLLSGGDPTDYAGFTLASADLDGDGASDLIVGAMLADGPQNARADGGEAYVLPGRSLTPGSTVVLEQTSGIVYGARGGDRLTEGMTTGDVNGDGKPDLVLVATFSAGPDGSRAGAGETYVINSPATLPLDLALAAPSALEVLGADAGDQLGHSVGAGDTDGDGAADLWLGAVSADGPGNTADLAGEAALVKGKRPTGTVIDEGAEQANAIVYGPEREARLGRSLAVGDLNGDHLADVAISAPNLDGRAGRVFIVAAGEFYPENAEDANIVLYGLDLGDTLGFESHGMPSLSTSDVDGDGRLDVLVSADGGDGPDNRRKDCGEAYVVWGATLGS